MSIANEMEKILQKRVAKLEKHYIALKEYKELICQMIERKNIYNPSIFASLPPQERAVLDAYLKRFSAIQDFLGAKIFPLLLERAGINSTKMSEVLYHVEKEEIIDSLESWVELREVRNELEHDYPDELEEALGDLRFCIDSFERLESYYCNAMNFAERYSR